MQEKKKRTWMDTGIPETDKDDGGTHHCDSHFRASHRTSNPGAASSEAASREIFAR